MDALRKLVASKFTDDVEHVPRRFRGKHTDVHGVFGNKFVKSCLKRPAAVEVLKRPAKFDVTSDEGWSVLTLTRKSGILAGKTYNVFVGPDGRRCSTEQKKRCNEGNQ